MRGSIVVVKIEGDTLLYILIFRFRIELVEPGSITSNKLLHCYVKFSQNLGGGKQHVRGSIVVVKIQGVSHSTF